MLFRLVLLSFFWDVLDVDLSSLSLGISGSSGDVPGMFGIVPDVLDVDLSSLFIVGKPSHIV
jgi:hypothetical protein